MDIFIYKDGQNFGPYSVEQLRTFNLSPKTLIWHTDLGDRWVSINDDKHIYEQIYGSQSADFSNRKYPTPPPTYNKTSNTTRIILICISVFFALLFIGLLINKSGGSREVAEDFASKYAYKFMKVANPSTGGNPKYELNKWDYKSKKDRYTIEFTSVWNGTTFSGETCEHEMKTRLFIDSDGSNGVYEILSMNDCMRRDVNSDSDLRNKLGL